MRGRRGTGWGWAWAWGRGEQRALDAAGPGEARTSHCHHRRSDQTRGEGAQEARTYRGGRGVVGVVLWTNQVVSVDGVDLEVSSFSQWRALC